MFALLANGPALFPTPGAPASEWAVWGACASAAALLGGWGLLNRNRPERDTAVGVSLLVAMLLVGGLAVFSTHRSYVRSIEQNRIEREQRESELRERELHDESRRR